MRGSRVHTLKRALGHTLPLRAVLRRAQASACVIMLAALLITPLSAQFGYFGQNKIQYRSFDWRVLRGEHVDLYFYPEEEELGRVALAYAEESYGVLERRFMHHVQRRVPLIIYASHTDFEQTNVLPFVPPEGLLGVTEFLKRRVALPFTGSYNDFRHTIRHELVHVFQLSLVAEVFRRYPRFRRAELPLWWSEGLAEFFSAGEDSRDEMILRDLTLSGRLPTLRELAYAAGGIVYPVGGVIHRFLALSSGEWRIGELYRDLWKYSSFEDAVWGVYGRSLDQLSDEWQFWMRRRYYPSVAAGEPLALTARVLTKLAIKPAVYAAGDSAGGILYFSPSTGYTNIYAQSFAGGRARTVVFSSDRTAYGPGGARNLFRLDLASGRIDYLTYGDWRDEQPRWSAETGRIYFASDRDGTYQIYAVDSTGAGYRLTSTVNGAFDPQWAGGERGLVFGGFADLSYNIYVAHPAPRPDGAPPEVTLAAERRPPEWTWAELEHPQYARADASPYEHKFTFDFAAGDAIVAPGLGSAQGAVFLLSDMLSDHQVFFTLSSFQGEGLGNLIDNFNGTAFYLNQSRRVNWGVGAFRLRGLFYEGDLQNLFEETAVGAFGQVRYPLSRFRRLEAEYRIEHSDRLDLRDTSGSADVRRVGWLASNFFSYVEDNTLWLSTGPIDGRRMNLTAGLVNDVSHGRFDTWLAALDYRRYFRTSLRSAVALRLVGYYAGGERPHRVNIGGSWGLRGYPLFGYVAGTRAWLFNAEWRFPITEFLSVGFPFGVARFPGVQGALFLDLGRAWTAAREDRGTLGSAGLGLRMPVGPPLVLRLDLGYRFSSGLLDAYTLPSHSRGSRFVDFFFGFNY